MGDAGGAKSRNEIAARLRFPEHRYLPARRFAYRLRGVVALARFPDTAHLIELRREPVAREHLVVAVHERIASKLAPKRIDRLVLFIGDAHPDVDSDIDRPDLAPGSLL